MVGSRLRSTVLFALVACCGAVRTAQAQQFIPRTQTTALDGHPLSFPKDLPARATILILGFGRQSQQATTAWEKPTRLQLLRPGLTSFYDMAMLAEVPAFVRPFVLRAIKHEVPNVLKPNFLVLTEDEEAWKRISGYAADQPEAAYVMLVDRQGRLMWSTHAPYSVSLFAELGRRANDLATNE